MENVIKLIMKSENNQTELSTLAKKLDQEGTQYTIEYHLLENVPAYSPEAKRCALCTAEKHYILFGNLPNLINAKSEITSTCRHRAKFKLQNTKI